MDPDPDTTLLNASFTVTANALAKAVLVVADCGVVPALAVMDAAVPAVLVSEKVTVVSPVAAAETAATPDALVATVIVGVLLLKTPDGGRCSPLM